MAKTLKFGVRDSVEEVQIRVYQENNDFYSD